MLKRVLEPEVMDTLQDAEEYDTMDHSEVNRKFVADFLKIWNGQSPILDVGTGTALIPIEFCKQSDRGEIIAIDLAKEMLNLAHKNVTASHMENRIDLRCENAHQLSFADQVFPVIISNSIIHHIPDPEKCFAEIVRVAKKGAIFFIRDLMRPVSLVHLEKLVDLHTIGASAYQKKLFADSLHAALTLEEVRKIVAAYGFPEDSVQATSDRHWTWSIS